MNVFGKKVEMTVDTNEFISYNKRNHGRGILQARDKRRPTMNIVMSIWATNRVYVSLSELKTNVFITVVDIYNSCNFHKKFRCFCHGSRVMSDM